MTDFKALQAYGAHNPGNVIPRYMAMGSWSPASHRRPQASVKKAAGRTKKKIHVLKTDLKFDRKGYTIL